MDLHPHGRRDFEHPGRYQHRWRGEGEGIHLTCDVLGGKNSKEKAGFPDRWASANFSLICMLYECDG